jgi:hypothetical protein
MSICLQNPLDEYDRVERILPIPGVPVTMAPSLLVDFRADGGMGLRSPSRSFIIRSFIYEYCLKKQSVEFVYINCLEWSLMVSPGSRLVISAGLRWKLL